MTFDQSGINRRGFLSGTAGMVGIAALPVLPIAQAPPRYVLITGKGGVPYLMDPVVWREMSREIERLSDTARNREDHERNWPWFEMGVA